MIKNIVFDIGNVIAYIDYEEAANGLFTNEEDRKFVLDNVLRSPEWSKNSLIDMGYFSLNEFISIICDRFNNEKDEVIKRFMYDHYDYFYMSEKVLNLIKVLKSKGYNIYLLSNLNDAAFNIYKPTGLFDIVDGYVLSYKEHHVKPHKGIYKVLFERFNLNPEESIFIDDRLDNCQTGESFGMKYINVKPNNYEDLEKQLKDKKIIE